MLARKKQVEEILGELNGRVSPKEAKGFMREHGFDTLFGGLSYADMIRRSIDPQDIIEHFGILKGRSRADIETAVIDVKYEGYIRRGLEQIEKAKALEDKKLPTDIDYEKIDGLRLEARQKLNKIRPENLGQAGRISGVNPADIAVLMVYLSLTHKK